LTFKLEIECIGGPAEGEDLVFNYPPPYNFRYPWIERGRGFYFAEGPVEDSYFRVATYRLKERVYTQGNELRHAYQYEYESSN